MKKAGRAAWIVWAAVIVCLCSVACSRNHDSSEVGSARVSGILPAELDGSTALGLAAELEVADGAAYPVEISPGGTLSAFIATEFTGNHQLTMSFFVPYSGPAAAAAGAGDGRLLLGQAFMDVYIGPGMNDITFDFSTFYLSDDDGDGLTNLDELILGTDPLSKNVVEQYLPYLDYPTYGIQDVEINAMHFTSTDEGWAVGYNYLGPPLIMHHQSDGWKSVDVTVTGNDPGLNSVQFTSKDEGWAVGEINWRHLSGESGLLLHYQSGQWSQVTAPDVGSNNWWLNSVFFTSADEGWAAGRDEANDTGVMLHYVSGAWSPVDLSGLGLSSLTLKSVYFTGPDDGWAVGSEYAYFDAIGFWDYCGVILHYTGGAWTVASSPLDMFSVARSDINVRELDAVRFVSTDEGWATGFDGLDWQPVILHYSQGAWSREDLSALGLIYSGYSLYSISFPAADEGWAAGRIFYGGGPFEDGLLLHYQNGTWTRVTTPLLQDTTAVGPPRQQCLNAVFFPAPDKGWVGGTTFGHYGGGQTVLEDLVQEFDNGEWRVSSPLIKSTSSLLWDVSFLSASEGWAVGWDYTQAKVMVLHYLDGAWENDEIPQLDQEFWGTGVKFLTPDLGWIVGYWYNSSNGYEGGNILHYDSGLWSEDPVPDVGSTNWVLQSASFPSADQGWAAGSIRNGMYLDKGIVLKYDSGSWSNMTLPVSGSTTWALCDIKFTSIDQGWASGYWSVTGQSGGQEPGDRGLLLHYDSGVWTDVSSSLPDVAPGWGLFKLNFLSADEGWVSGIQCQDSWTDCSGLVLHYQGGVWTAMAMPAVDSSSWLVTQVSFPTADEGWAIGEKDAYIYPWKLLVLHYIGGQWQVINDVVMAPRSGAVYGESVDCPDQDHCWFGGFNQGSSPGTGFILKY